MHTTNTDSVKWTFATWHLSNYSTSPQRFDTIDDALTWMVNYLRIMAADGQYPMVRIVQIEMRNPLTRINDDMHAVNDDNNERSQ